MASNTTSGGQVTWTVAPGTFVTGSTTGAFITKAAEPDHSAEILAAIHRLDGKIKDLQRTVEDLTFGLGKM